MGSFSIARGNKLVNFIYGEIMDIYHITTVMVGITGGIIIPLLFRQLNKAEERAKENSRFMQKLAEKSLTVQREIDHIQDLIKGIYSALEHRSEVAQLKYNILKDKIEDLESYLEKVNGYRRKQTKRTNDAQVKTLYNTDDDVNTGIFK